MNRIVSIDVLRGIVMVIMALDHVRDFFTNVRFDPSDLTRTTPALFFTRWITHFCAPTFVFLAGTGAFFYGVKNNKAQLSRFLWTRGLLLVVLEHTLVQWAFSLNFNYNLILFEVIWAIGISMIVLAALVYLPLQWIAIIGIAMIVGHNALDGITPDSFGSLGWLWSVLHVQSFKQLSPSHSLLIAYPLIPWIGVMAAGYAFGNIYLLVPERRRKILWQLGLGSIAAFLLIRGIDVYGDPRPWASQKSGLYTFFSFFNTTKYPPSLSFLLMTLGPAITLLAIMEKGIGKTGPFFRVYGKVPLFYFIVHLFIIHLLSVVAGVLQGFPVKNFFQFVGFFPQEYGFDLWAVYLWWIGIVLLLYPLCKWYGNLKSKSNNVLLSYI